MLTNRLKILPADKSFKKIITKDVGYTIADRNPEVEGIFHSLQTAVLK